jgi:hypothetical protein
MGTPRTRRAAWLSATVLAGGVIGVALAVAPVDAQFFGFGGNDAERRLVGQFDADGNGRLDAAERARAREGLVGGRSRRGARQIDVPPRPLAPAGVDTYADRPLYDPDVVRTFFLTFENPDWESELEDFYNSDVDVPATLVVDGNTYPDVGVHFRGNSSYRRVPTGYKRSLNLSLDWVHDGADIDSYQTFNLNNDHEDPSFIRYALYMHIAREYIPAPKASFVRVAINGDNWGVYTHAQQFNGDFIRDWWDTRDGARWEVPGSPRGRGGLEYFGNNPGAYRRVYEIDTDDDPAAWAALIELTRVLNETPLEDLETALAPVLDVDNVLRFLALEVALVNADGYWTRASDYSLYLDVEGRFHVIPHDANETFHSEATGPGFGARTSGVTLDPLTGIDDPTKPLRSRLLAVPALRERYLDYVQDIAVRYLDWATLGPLTARFQGLIAGEVEADRRKLGSFRNFPADGTGPDSIRTFAERRREFLLNYTLLRRLNRGAGSAQAAAGAPPRTR